LCGFQFSRAAKKGAEACEEFTKFERLGQIIIGTVIESGDAILNGVSSGEHQNGNSGAGLAEAAANFKTAEAGKHDVQNDQIVGIDFGLLESFVAGSDGIDGIGLFLQAFDDKTLDAQIVLCE
jgi:hypothetical protein